MLFDDGRITEKLILIVGFSASGKDTLARALQNKGYHLVVSCTTRPMRAGEQDEIDYNYLSTLDFLNKVHNGEIIEHRKYNTEYNGIKDVWYYGTESSQISSKKMNVAVVDFDGVRFFKQNTDYDITAIFLNAEDEVRRARCISRGDYDEVEFNRRLKDDNEKLNVIDNIRHIDRSIDANWTPEQVLKEYERVVEND